ncbi:hypothetical protein ACU4GD_00640 [Cupriavidus basilensis]
MLRVSDRIAVLRGGRLVAACAAAQTSKAELAELMVGRVVSMPETVAPRGMDADGASEAPAVLALQKGLARVARTAARCCAKSACRYGLAKSWASQAMSGNTARPHWRQA